MGSAQTSARLGTALIFASLVLPLQQPLSAQTPLGTPTATFPEDFGTIQTVRNSLTAASSLPTLLARRSTPSTWTVGRAL